jgi:uncharacterized protein (TIGR02145 family)
MNKIFTTLAVIAIIFSCKKKDSGPPPTAPTVKTAALSNTTSSSVTAGGSIVSDNGATVTKSGIAMSLTNATPTTSDSLLVATATTGTFTVNINGIDFGKTYYFRAFATNSIGTGYGDVVTLTTSNDSVRFAYNGQSVTYGIIISPTTGKKWLDRNIGAKRQATAFKDYQAYGDLFQWGRPADGHQLINWTSSTAGTAVNGTTTTQATTDNPGHSNFIIGNGDWRSDNNGNRWAITPQGPCPAGWHVPTKIEWLAETAASQGGTATSGGIEDDITGYSKLKLTGAGFRAGTGSSSPAAGQFWGTGNYGSYWSSSDYFNGTYHNAVEFEVGGGYAGPSNFNKSDGYGVRCIKD